ncbi:MAG: DNA-3-methyladenine glycosylase 2 family protein [Deltaproteobacteria bacterium]|nr:DNA-3-methyladenine glycosylase 2 family protein [Deltaproteobacteria bacterium]
MRSETFEFDLQLPGPLDYAASLEIFRRSGDDMLDRWDGRWLIRIASDAAGVHPYACQAVGGIDAPVLRVAVRDAAEREVVEAAIRAAFLPLVLEFEHLCAVDPLIARLAIQHHGFRPVLQADLLTALVRCISAQQVNLKWAATMRRRLAETFGRAYSVGEHRVYRLDPERLAALQITDIRALQFTTRKAEYIINAARAVANGELNIANLAGSPDEEVIAKVTAIRGLGLWTAEWVLARTLGRPRVSAGDLGVRKAVGIAYLGGAMASPEEVRQATAHWGGAAALAQGLLLHAQHEKTLHKYAATVSHSTLVARQRRMSKPGRAALAPRSAN